MDKCQSQEGAESALEELEHYLSTRGQQSQHIDLDIIWRDYDVVLNGEFRVSLVAWGDSGQLCPKRYQ